MPLPEFLSWQEFYKLHPFDDYYRIYRPAALIARSLGGGDIQQMLDYLEPDRGGMSEADMNTIRAMGFTRKGG